jgi:hypothetical protein
MARMKQTLRYQSKEDLQRVEEIHRRPTEETTAPPDTPTTTDSVVPTAVPSASDISTVVTTITTAGPTSVTTIVDNTGTNTITIITTATLGINIETRYTTPAAVASKQPVIKIDSDSDSDEELITPEPKQYKSDKY